MALETADDLAVFFDPEEFGEAALYVAACGLQARIIVLRTRPDELIRFGQGQIISATNVVRFLRSQVPQLSAGDRFFLGEQDDELGFVREQEFVVTGEPMLDGERLIWTCGAEPIDP